MAANLFCNSKLVSCLVGLLLVALLSISGTLEAGVLSGDSNAMLSGREDFVINGVNVADVEYAVYLHGQSFPEGPVYPNDYVYAYQIFVEPGDANVNVITILTVGLHFDAGANNQNSLDGSGDVTPNGQSVGFGGGDAAVWNFTGPPIFQSQNSDILYYSSPYLPTVDVSTLARGTSASAPVQLPSPSDSEGVPEPGILSLLGAGAALLSLSRLTRRRSA